MNQFKSFFKSFSWLVLITAGGVYLLQTFNFINLMSKNSLRGAMTISGLVFLTLLIDQALPAFGQQLKRRGINNNISQSYLVTPALIALESLIIYLLIIIPTEYLLTEHWLIWKRVSQAQKTGLFLAVFLIVFLFNQPGKSFRFFGKKHWPIIFLFLIGLLWGNGVYRGYYNRRQEIPRIYSLSSDWSIVGKQITIDGKNFGPVWRAGKVAVDDLEFMVVDWSEEKIIIAQPHPDRFFSGTIMVKNWRGNTSNSVDFEIRDPEFLAD